MANKDALAEKVLEKVAQEGVKFTKKQSKEVVTATFDAITEFLAEGEKVSISSFGTFDTKHREARKGRNPKTGEEIQIGAKTVATFKKSPKLNDLLNQ